MGAGKWKVRGEVRSHREVVVRTVQMTLLIIVIADLADFIANSFFAPWQIVRSAIQTTLISGTMGAVVVYTHARANLKLYEMKSYLAQLSHIDSLTGLLNRRAFIETAAASDRSIRHVLMLVDIDAFKLVNDHYGHPAGDAVIARVADILRRVFASHTPVARLGGEEFAALLLPETMQDALLQAEVFRVQVGTQVFGPTDAGFGVKVSIGLAEFSAELSFEEVYSRADRAMYTAKRRGGDLVCVFEPGIEDLPIL